MFFSIFRLRKTVLAVFVGLAFCLFILISGFVSACNDLDKNADLYVLEKLSNLLNLSQDEKVISSKSEKSVSKSEQDLSEISFNLPINFYIKNE